MKAVGVVATDIPPKRKEGGGFIIADIFSSFTYKDTDPFLMWHELPRKFMKKGEFPGAPMHPHRGFSEVPYFKAMGQTQYSRKVAGHEEEGKMGNGDLEWGMCAHGIEHGVTVSPDWCGEMHGFQLWVNLPSANKMDPPEFQNAASAVLPRFEYSPRFFCKVLVGEMEGHKSPVEPKYSQIQYFDFEAQGGGDDALSIPLTLERRIVYCYAGSITIGDKKLQTGEVALLTSAPNGNVLHVSGLSTACSFLLIEGTPLNEPCVQYGPFVMSTKEQIQQAFESYHRGQLTTKPATYKRFGYDR